ncbi:MAG: hypothetical protein JO369_01185 [Paucibacter sp.]|nr:hypothetical protein [Roseateles sp.]
MKLIHVPKVDSRYWAAITLASVFGTNLGDFYAHESGLGVGWGLLLLAAVVVAALLAERIDTLAHQLYYWLAIIIIRTGATNIADYLAFRVRIPGLALTLGLAALIAVFGWRSARAAGQRPGGLPDTGASYWLAMLAAGVFGTVLGDICSHAIGQGASALILGVLLALALLLRRQGVLAMATAYWGTVAVARTAGTAMGDWLAENKLLNIGLPLSTLLTGAAFVAVLLLWRSRPSTGGRASLGAAA